MAVGPVFFESLLGKINSSFDLIVEGWAPFSKLSGVRPYLPRLLSVVPGSSFPIGLRGVPDGILH